MKKKNRSYLFRIFRFLIIGIIVSLLASFLIEYFHTGFDNERIINFILEDSEIYLIGAVVFFPIYLWATSIFGSSIIGGTSTILISLILGISNFLKIQYRNEPLYPNELSLVTELPFLIDMITIGELLTIIAIFIIIIALIVFLYRTFSLKRKGVLSTKLHIFWRIATIIIASAGLFHISQFNNPDNLINAAYSDNVEWVAYNQNINYSNNGFVASFLYNLGSEYMSEPPNYSSEMIEEIQEKYSSKARSINENRDHQELDTNVVFIMNESFTDPSRIEEFEFNEDPIPYTRDLMDQTLSGQSLAQGYGGGTANSEFEALTSFAIEPFASQVSTPYAQAADMMDQISSFVQKANDSGLTTTAIHPYNPRLYRRPAVYNNLGFDKFIHEETMEHTDKIENSDYISDESAYKEVINTLENSDSKDFIHLVTMQNHMSYRYKYDDPSFESSGASNPDEGDGYLQDLYHSDLALKTLIEYIDEYDEEVLVVFWGDHLPSIFSSEVIEQNSMQTMRETPLFFYSNQRDLSGDVGTISPIFFLNHILESGNMKVTPFEALLLELENVLPGIYGGLYLENDSEEPKNSRDELNEDTEEIFNEYHYIQYDMVSGSRHSQSLGFFDPVE